MLEAHVQIDDQDVGLNNIRLVLREGTNETKIKIPNLPSDSKKYLYYVLFHKLLNGLYVMIVIDNRFQCVIISNQSSLEQIFINRMTNPKTLCKLCYYLYGIFVSNKIIRPSISSESVSPSDKVGIYLSTYSRINLCLQTNRPPKINHIDFVKEKFLLVLSVSLNNADPENFIDRVEMYDLIYQEKIDF